MNIFRVNISVLEPTVQTDCSVAVQSIYVRISLVEDIGCLFMRIYQAIKQFLSHNRDVEISTYNDRVEESEHNTPPPVGVKT
jgi:hypothetical protein